MDRLPPHKRRYTTLYRAHFWRLKALEMKEEKTSLDKHEILHEISELDKLWRQMPLDQKRDIDPLWEVTCQMGGRWTEVKLLRCPHCGWMIEVSSAGDGPPRCAACMLDIDITSILRESKASEAVP